MSGSSIYYVNSPNIRVKSKQQQPMQSAGPVYIIMNSPNICVKSKQQQPMQSAGPVYNYFVHSPNIRVKSKQQYPVQNATEDVTAYGNNQHWNLLVLKVSNRSWED